MAKEKTRSNKEAKKPKQEKPAAAPAGGKGSPFPPAADPKKKK